MADTIRAALERLLSDIQDLSDSSQGIVGLHRNGDPAPWNELLEGGRYSSWLGDAIEAARAALAEQQGNEAQVSLFVDSHIDPEHQGEDRQILHVFYDACMSEGGTAEEINLRGLRAVLSRWGHQPARLRNCPTHGQQPPEAWGCPECVRELREELHRTVPVQPTPPAEGEVAELVTLLAVGADCSGGAKLSPDQCHRAADLLLQQEARIAELDQKLEIERMRVVACGAVAMADTPSSAAKARACHPDYWSASADDIARQIDQLMRLRAAQQTPVPVSEREVLARWGHQPTPPAEGEVAELVAWMESQATAHEAAQTQWAKRFVRAAELLQQQEAEILTSTGKPMTDYRALCAELFKACETLYKQSVTASHHQTITLSNGEHPIPISSDMLAQDAVFGDLLHRTRAALAELASDGPAVPESREPASVAGKSSDENCWQWYTYCPEEGLDMYSDRKQAQSAAQSIMGSYEVAAHSDGWHEDMELVSWGMLVPVEQAQVVERKTAEPDDEFDEWVKYELRPVRWDRQPTPPAEGEVAELLAELEVAAVTVESEGGDHEAGAVRRAAELLQQQHPTPVPVSEGLPGAADIDFEFVVFDADYCTQAGGVAPTYAQALSEGQRYLAQYQQDGRPHTLQLRRVEVLHPGALPQGEV